MGTWGPFNTPYILPRDLVDIYEEAFNMNEWTILSSSLHVLYTSVIYGHSANTGVVRTIYIYIYIYIYILIYTYIHVYWGSGWPTSLRR